VPMESITFRAPRDLKAAAELVARIEKTSVGDLARTSLLTYLTFIIASWDNEITEAFRNSFSTSRELNEAMKAGQELVEAWPLRDDTQGT
jgi:hypothetical protein